MTFTLKTTDVPATNVKHLCYGGWYCWCF